LSILGFDVKPLEERFQEAVGEIVNGFPYELWPKDWFSRFWPNMSVRYVLAGRKPGPPDIKGLRKAGPPRTYKLLGPIPRLYFQDRWVVKGEEELTALLEYDLRTAGYCRGDVWGGRPRGEELSRAEALPEEEAREHFTSLQQDNRVVSTDFSNPNRVVVEVDVSRPGMLVMTDVWHPDWRVVMGEFGEGIEKVHRVNYLQRGVWCRPGRYEIVMEFLPSSLRTGLTLTAMGIIVLLGIILLPVNKIKGSKSPGGNTDRSIK